MLIEKPREKRRKDINLSQAMIDKIVNGLANHTILEVDIDRVIDALNTDPTMTVESIRKFAVPPITEEEISTIIKEEIQRYNFSELKSDKIALKLAKAKIIGIIMDKTKRVMEGFKIAEKIDSFLEEAN